MLDNLKKNGHIQDRSFSFYLSFENTEWLWEDGSELIIGGYDEKYIEGDKKEFVYADVQTNSSSLYDYWAVKMDKITVGSQDMNIYSEYTSSLRTVIDSGVSFMMFQADLHNKFIYMINSFNNANCSYD